MAKRTRTARTTEPNAGLKNRYAKKVATLIGAFHALVADEIFLHVANQGLLAEDHSLSNPKTPKDKERLRQIRRLVLAAWKRDPEAFRRDVDSFVQMHVGAWSANLSPAAEKLAEWYARHLAADVTASQRRAYIAAGISPDVFKDKWTIPVVRQKVGKTAAERLPQIVEWSTELITKTALRDIYRLQDVITDGLSKGQSVDRVRRTLATFKGFDKDRASRVAIDQTNKITQGILRANDEDLGVTEGVWIHVPGQYTSRDTHKRMHGKRFDLSKGLFDSDVGDYVLPATLPFCRCLYRPVIPDSLK